MRDWAAESQVVEVGPVRGRWRQVRAIQEIRVGRVCMGIFCGRGVGVPGRCGRVRKHVVIKCDMAGHDDAASGEVVVPIAFVLERVSEENAAGGARSKFMVGGGI